ncbi:N-acetyltransferase [Paramuribaculum intestinale]|uniref:N-acetyltransferase n=5 Tax=Muribaculaceae TaxID=2005473 RepID=A0A2V1IP50_9BACT|nr:MULTISPECIES: GNAT family N-acetyltransferase [Muribaculaceae]PWB06195.1 N-acetyltransferase [Paramuribaculum intestinale]
MDTTYIETERLILRSWRMTDRAVFAEINSNNKVMRYFPKPLSIDESNGFVDRINSEFEETGFGLYAVEIKETGEFIGYVGFHRFAFDVPFSPGWEIGWRISDKFWNKGYATEAAMACIKYAQEKKLCNRLYSFTAVPNIASENVMKRIGMSFEGLFMHPALAEGHWLKEHKLYSLDL